MGKLKDFLREVKTELKTEKVDPERTRKVLLISSGVSVMVWAGFAVAAAAMVVSLGAWPWVAYPFALYWWGNHTARVIQTYQKAFKPKPKPKWEQNVTFNVSTDLTEEQIAAAVRRATDVDLRYGA